jgi:hypothetical protein
MIANLSGTPSRLCQKLLTTSEQLLYTAPVDGRTAVLDINVVNLNAAAKTFSLYINLPDSANCLIYNYSIAAGSYLRLNQAFIILNQGETLYAYSNANSSINITISGVERI